MGRLPGLGLLRRLGELPVRRPWMVVLWVLLTLPVAALLASALEIRTSFTELLPASRSSVIELDRVKARLAGISNLVVVIQGEDEASIRKFIDRLVPGLRALGPHYVAGVDDGEREIRDFISKHRHLYAELAEIEALRDEVAQRYDYEVGKRTGLDLGLDDEPPEPISAETLRARFQKSLQALSGAPRNYYIGEGGRLGAVVVRTPYEFGDPRAFELQSRILALARALEPSSWDPTLRVLFTGNLMTSAEEHNAAIADLTNVGTIGVVLVLAVVFLFFLRARVLLTMAFTILCGCLWSFAAAYVTVGHLNSATGFLVSIIAGNGINFGIVLMARYVEARVRDRASAEAAVRTAMRSTAFGTLTAALCASVAYGSLAATDFRGFRHFGVIGGIGMLLCWLASYTILPALLMLGERLTPLSDDPKSWRNRWRGLYGRPFAHIATRAPRLCLLIGGVSFAFGLVLAVRFVVKGPLEHDLAKIRNDAPEPTSARQLARRVAKFVPRTTRESVALLADRLDQVEPLTRELERRRDSAPAAEKPFDRVISLFELLPKNQPEKIAAWQQILDRLQRARARGFIGSDDWARIEAELPRFISPLGVSDLPREVAWPFEEKDGTRGRIVYLVPTAGRSLNDANYLMQWADSFREVRLPNGEVIWGTGDPVIFADMLKSVQQDAPRALLFSFVGTLLVIAVAFRGRTASFLAMASVVLGLVWLLSCLALAGIKFNFLNFVALPISVGVGSDYAVNVMRRNELEGRAGLLRALVETGGAMVLCSLATLLGYGALTLSINGAVRSFGVAGALGEITMLFAAMLVVPAFVITFLGARSRLRPRELPPRSAEPTGE